MDGPAATPTQARETSWTQLWRDGRLLLVLLLVATGLRAWSIRHTEVASRDSIGFIRYAYELETFPLPQVLKGNLHHPGYPATLLAVSIPLRQWLGGTTPASMQLSAQLTSALTGVLLVFPMFYLGRLLFDRGVGFWAALLFQCLPVSSHMMADGLSDPTYLLIVSTTLLLAVRGVRSGKGIYFALVGVGAGLAYLTRPEGPLLAITTGLVVIGVQLIRGWREPWSKVLTNLALLFLAGLVVGEPYAAIIGTYTLKTTPRVIAGDKHYKEYPGEQRSKAPAPVGGPLLAVYHAPGDELWGLRGIGIETSKSLGYVACFPAVLGLWWYRGRFREPGAWVLLVACLLQVLILWRMTYVMGYVSERHVMILVLCATFWAVAALRDVPGRLAQAIPWLTQCGRARYVPIWSVGLLLAMTGVGLPSALKPLHSNRAGHHAVGLWLHEHSEPADEIYDPFCWSHYYAGKIFEEGKPRPLSPGHQPVAYVVVEESDNPHARLPFFPIARELMAKGTLVYRWLPSGTTHKKDQAAEVDVYSVPIEAYQIILSHHQW